MRKPYWYIADGVVNIASTKPALASALGVDLADIAAADVAGQTFYVAGTMVNRGEPPSRAPGSGRLVRAERSDIALIRGHVTHRLGVYR